MKTREGPTISIRAASLIALAVFQVGLPLASAQPLPNPDEWTRRGEQELARGDATAANEDFDRAAAMRHAADTEMGLVRSYMQAGQYRRALAFCAHVAGAHRDSPAGSALYAWLLRAGGQGDFAERVLSDALGRSPNDAVLLEVRRAFSSPLPLASDLLQRPPHRMAPRPVALGAASESPAGARVVSSAILIGDGTMALVPSAAVRSTAGGKLWVRNGLGQAVRAVVDESHASLRDAGAVVLRLETRMEIGQGQTAARDPFAGSPGVVLMYATSDDATAAWPWLTQGFLGSVIGTRSQLRQLGIDVPNESQGALVMDADGRVAGMVLTPSGGEARMLPASAWRDLPPGGTLAADAARPKRTSRAIPADEAYERGLLLSLQFIHAP